MRVARGVPLGALTTLEVGGPAWGYAEASTPDEARAAVAKARAADKPVFVLGGGSNLLVADAGYDGLILRYTAHAITQDGLRLRVEAGVEWDALVERSLGLGLYGLECLSGIPGRVGAAPIQNIGAYGVEVAEHIEAVEVLDPSSGTESVVPASECAFGYRTSRFKADRLLVTAVRLTLTDDPTPVARYPELAARVDASATRDDVRREVLALRRSKSMVLDPADPNRRSAGSFFLNPVVPDAEADALFTLVASAGLGALPRYAAEGGMKLSAAWLIERSGFAKGYGQGAAGLSTRHCLALVNRGGATASELVALAREVRRGVRDRFGVTLTPEPVLLGFDAPIDDLLD